MSAKIETLRRFGAFAGFSDEELAEVVALCQEESYKEGDILAVEGEPAEKLLLILEGKVSLEKLVQLGRSGSARRATVGIVGPDGVIGWSSIIAPYIYTSTGVCLEPLYALALNGQEVRRFVARYPASGIVFLEVIAATISSRLHNTMDTLAYFLSIISHELKSPLAAIENYLQVVLGGFAGPLTDRQRRMLERSVLRVNDLRALITDIVDLARMRPEQIQADFEWLDPAESGAQALEDVRLAASQKDVQVRVQAPAKFQLLVAARRRLRQVFSNLLANAVKFSPPGGTVILHARDEPDRLVVEVMDEGMGIPADEQALVFEDFFRSRNAKEVAGSGLGLSIARKIVEAHAGEIWVESPYAEGKPGAKFTVAIPRGLATPDMKRRDRIGCQETAPSVARREEV
jgi:signal transduction histidine kinase